MPVFLLSVVRQEAGIGDAVRTEACNLDHARSIALEGIRDILSHELSEGRLDLRWRIDIAAEDGTLLGSVPFAESVRIY